MDLGSKIKELRRKRGMTLQQVAEKSGLSPSLLSQIERNLVSTSVGSLWKIAEALGVPIGYFFFDKGEEDSYFVVKKDKRKKIVLPESKVTYELLSPDLKRRIEFLIVEIQPGECNTEEKIAHEGEECGLVLKGKLKVKWGEREFVLEEGDSIYFDSTVPHRFQNIGDDVSVSVWAMTPPSF